MQKVSGKLVARLEEAALASARYLLNQIARPSSIEMWHKKDNSLVMTLDIESQKIISKVLEGDLPIVGEEDEKGHELLAAARDYFVIDPVDGTASCKRFLKNEGGQLGFGPIVGLVQGGRVVASCFYHVPFRTLYTAVKGEGAYQLQCIPLGELGSIPELKDRKRLMAGDMTELKQAGVLFFPGSRGECRIIEHLKGGHLIENAYRFGGFANDCVRLACGYEQVQVQFSVKSWDFPACLITAEAGLKVIVDPLDTRTDFYEWTVQPENPVISSVPSLVEKVLEVVSLTSKQ